MSTSNSNSSHQLYTNEEKYDLSARNLSDLTEVKIPQVLFLILSNNQFTDLSSLPRNNELQVLYADNNKIATFDPNNFNGCPSLLNLKLSFNQITKIPDLTPLQSLKSLDLAGNEIGVLQNIEGVPNLTTLSLSKNKIYSVDVKRPIQNLLKLDLRRNPLDRIQFGDRFPCLISLHLDHCFLDSFSGLNEMKSLRKLTLSFNKINDSQHLNLPNLEYLNVSNNALTNIESFSNLTKLTVLNISFNPIDDQGFSTSAKLLNLRSLNVTGTQLVHPNLIYRFAPNVEKLDLENTRISQLQDVQALVKKSTQLVDIDLRGTPLTSDYYPSIQGQQIESRDNYESIEGYDSQYPQTKVPRGQYRQSVLFSAFSGNLQVLDGIRIVNDEARIVREAKDQKQKKNYEEVDVSENEPVYDGMNQESRYNDTDELVNHLEKKNENLKNEKKRLQRESLIDSINQLFEEQDQLRSQLNMPPINDRSANFQQYSLGQLAEYKQKNLEIIRSLKERINDKYRNFNTSDVLNQEKARNKSLKKELKKLKATQHQIQSNEYNNENINNVDSAIDELQQENQRLSREMVKAKNHKFKKDSSNRNNYNDNRRRNRNDDEFDVNKRPPDPNKVHLAGQLMAENALLRNTLGMDPLNYHPAESFSSSDIDKIISQLLDHNKIMREQVSQQSNNKSGKLPVKTQQMARYLQYLDLQGSREGCTFWVPLDAQKQKEQQEYYKDMQMRLPISVETTTKSGKKKKAAFKGCSKCEKAILMMSRVPLYPPDSPKIIEGSDEFQLVESWIITSLNRKVRINDVMKSSFFYRIIENERTMNDIHLYVIITDDPSQYLTNSGIDHPILVSEHFKYVNKQLKETGSANILICAFDVGNQATNFCEHTTIPNIQEIKSMDHSFDSLRFRYQNEEAVMVLNTSRIVPIYAVQVNEIE